MVDFPSNFLDPNTVMGFANGQSAGSWLALGINTILSTIVGGIVLMVLVEIFSHKFGESIKPQNAFLVVLIANVVTNFGILGLLSGFLASVSFLIIILPLVVWFVLIKLFFHEMNILHAFLAAVIFFVLSMLLIPYLTSFIAGFIPIGLA
jgi:hypothetical protein